MATASESFTSREDHTTQIELEEARKAGLAPAKVDEDGKEINNPRSPHMSSAPWYRNAKRPVTAEDMEAFGMKRATHIEVYYVVSLYK